MICYNVLNVYKKHYERKEKMFQKTHHRKRGLIIVLLILLFAGVGIFFAYKYNFIPHKKYTDKDFGITFHQSLSDKDGDGIDDYSDIITSAKEYVATCPKYKSKYYEGGYPNDEYGVCTDVVAFSLLYSGYDLQQLVDDDIRNNPDDYNIDAPDSNIDFRRVVNLRVYFSHTADSLTTDVEDYENWQAGDIVVWKHHVGIISDHRNSDGIPFVLHNGSPEQASYEEDILATHGEVVGHFRLKDYQNA